MSTRVDDARLFMLTVLSVLLVASSSVFSQVRHMSLSELTKRADVIVRAKVENTGARWVSDGRGKHIYSTVTLGCTQFLKGSFARNTIALEVVGGTVDSVTEWVSYAPTFTKGEELMLFLTNQLGLVGGAQGRVRINEGMVDRSGEHMRIEQFIEQVQRIIVNPNAPCEEKEQGANRQIINRDTANEKVATGLMMSITSNGATAEMASLGSRDSAPTKGLSFPATIQPAREVLEAGAVATRQVREGLIVPSRPANEQGWQTIITESFEGTFPSPGWTVTATGGYTDAYWGRVNCRYSSGSWSAWCAAAGSKAGTPCSGNYPSNMKAWMVYGPFSLSDATDANVQFSLWNATETNIDGVSWLVSVDGQSFYGSGMTGNSGGWQSHTFDLKNVYTLGSVLGQSQVWLAFVFKSDGSIEFPGAFVDDILLQETTDKLPDLVAMSMSLSSSTWLVGNSVTVGLTEQNSGSAAAGIHQSQLFLSTDSILTAGDRPLGTPIDFGAIAAGSTQTQSKSFTVPDVSNGTYWVGAIVDIGNSVEEGAENNNAGVRTGTVTIAHQNPQAPTISSMSPIKVSAGTDTTATISGSRFGSTQGSSNVEFIHAPDESEVAAPIVSWSDNTIVCKVPRGAGSGPVTVVSANGTSNDFICRITFDYEGVKWPGSTPLVQYRIHENFGGAAGEGVQVQAAAQTWNNAGANFLFQYGGVTSATTSSQNGINEILWGSIPGSNLSGTVAWITGSSITECDMVFDTTIDWSTSDRPGASQFDVESIALHEFGHFFLLGDLYGDIGDGEYDVAKVMYGFGSPGTIGRSLHQDDIAGIRWIYGTKGATAVPAPRADRQDNQATPSSYVLYQNHPNPFNPSTVIRYALPHESHVSLKVCDALGREVKTLVQELQAAGEHEVLFEAGELSSGVYFSRFQAGNVMQVRKMILVR